MYVSPFLDEYQHNHAILTYGNLACLAWQDFHKFVASIQFTQILIERSKNARIWANEYLRKQAQKLTFFT